MTRRILGRRSLLVFLLMVVGGPIAAPAMPVAGYTACSTSEAPPGDPHPGPAVPFIGGMISDGTGAPIAGATVLLTRCALGVAYPAGVQVSAVDGTFAFESLVADAMYVVSVPLEGVLGGKRPTKDTFNASWLIAGSHGDDHVDMAFE